MSMSTTQPSKKNAASSSRHNVRQRKQNTNPLERITKAVFGYLPTILNEKQIKHLKEHKYASEGTTLVDPYMQKFWKWLVEYCPLWVAPNLITIVGLVLNIGTSILLMIYTNGAREYCAGWIYFLTALGLFLYQSLDAIDGKQARRTNSSSPLGELFDHGCDSVSAVFVTIACCCSVQLGTHPWLMFWCCMLSYVAFYCAHWQTYVSGILRFGKLDCTEAQFSFIAVHMTSVIAPGLWAKTIPIINVEMRVFAALVMLGSTTWSSINNIYTLSQNGREKKFLSVAGTSIVFPAWPIGLFVFLAFIAASYSKSHALEEHIVLQLLCYGLVFSKLTNQLIVAHMSKSPLSTWDTAYVGPIAVCINQYFNYWIGEQVFLWLFLLYITFDLLPYNIKVCQELCDALNIHCFRIKPSTIPIIDTSH